MLFVTGRALVLTKSSFFLAACALDVQGKIQWTALCPGQTLVALRSVVDRKLPAGPRDLGPAKVLLDDGRLNAGITHDGSFLMSGKRVFLRHVQLSHIAHRPDVPAGTYVLSVLARNHAFDQVRRLHVDPHQH